MPTKAATLLHPNMAAASNPVNESPSASLDTAGISKTKSQSTFFTEVESIDICLKIIDLLELIHS